MGRYRKWVFAGLATGILMLGASGSVWGADFDIRLASIYNENHAVGFGLKKFAELVKEKTNGRANIDLFLNAELGTERENAEMVKTGQIEMTASGLSGIGLYVPGLDVLELPYLYSSMEELDRIANSLQPKMQEMLNEKGFHSVGFLYLGPRSTISVKPLRSFADFKGLKLRVPESPLYVGMAKAMGASPTPVPFTEVYTSLQTGIVEAMEGGADTVHKQRFYEVAKYFAMTRHIYHVQYVVINKKAFDGLPGDIQKALMEAGAEAGPLQAQENKRQVQLSVDALKKEGVEIIEVSDIDKFREACLGFNDQHAKSRGEKAYAVYKEAVRLSKK